MIIYNDSKLKYVIKKAHIESPESQGEVNVVERKLGLS